MFPVKKRLQKNDIDRIFKQGKSFKGSLLVLKVIKNNLEICRFGFIVSKKISKKASVRNKVKRRLREIVRLEVKSEKDTDNLLIALPGIEGKSFDEIKESVKGLFKKLKT